MHLCVNVRGYTAFLPKPCFLVRMYAIQNRYFPPYTYVFEDNWPKYGDFDLNDIVLTLKTDQPKQIQMVI